MGYNIKNHKIISRSVTEPGGAYFYLEVKSGRRYVTLKQEVLVGSGSITKAMTFPLEIFEDFLELDLRQKELLAATGRNADILRSCLDENIELVILASNDPKSLLGTYTCCKEDRDRLEKVLRSLASLCLMDNVRRTGNATL